MPKQNIVQLHLAKHRSGRPLGSHSQTRTYSIMCSNAIQNSANVQRSQPLNANVQRSQPLEGRLFEQQPGATVVISETEC
jgi:hypothetical protein